MDHYHISDIAKLLGLGSDTIRFYEKKGLVHPKTNHQNRYREYDLDAILELLDIVYYRHLGLSLGDISTILNKGRKEDMHALLVKKKEETEEKIRYEQQLVKKLSYVLDTYERLMSQRDICSIRPFPTSVILLESDEESEFFTRQIQQLSQDQFVLCSLYKTYERKGSKLRKGKTFITMEKDIIDQLHMELTKTKPLMKQEEPCVFQIVQLKDHTINPHDIERMCSYAKQQGLHLQEKLYTREIPLTSYHDEENYYAELYLPIQK